MISLVTVVCKAQDIPKKLDGMYCEYSTYVGYCVTFKEDSFHSAVGSMMFDIQSKGIYRIKDKTLTLYHSSDTLDEGNILRYEIIKVKPDEIIWKNKGDDKSVLKKSKQ